MTTYVPIRDRRVPLALPFRPIVRLDSIRRCEHVKRAIEVAASGGLSLHLIGLGSGMDDAIALALAAQHFDVAVTISGPCPCGHYGSADAPCACTPAGRARMWGSAPIRRALASDLIVQVPAPRLFGREPIPEPDERVRARIAAAQARPAPDARAASAETLMQCAVRMLGFDEPRVTQMWHVAGVIARMAAAPTIEAVHLAEAIQYRPPYHE